MQELNFEDVGSSLIDDLTYINIEYNVNQGMRWEDVGMLFGEDTQQAAYARYVVMGLNDE